MTLEIRRIEVSDKVMLFTVTIFLIFLNKKIKNFQGNWMCRVWNNEGSTTRNFTLHIVGKLLYLNL